MTIYRIRRGEVVSEVEGFSALVKMAQEGLLAPDDAVFVPASNRWHFARSIRQLREHFPPESVVEEPPPPAGRVRDLPRTPPAEPPPPLPSFEGFGAQTAPGDGESAGADIVPLRRGRWSPDGKIEVPVFNYDVDLEPPAVLKPLRFIAAIVAGLMIGGAVWLYRASQAQSLAQAIEAEGGDGRGVDMPILERPQPRPIHTVRPRATATPTAVAATATARPGVKPAAATPTPLPEFGAADARTKVLSARVTKVARPDALAAALRADLIRLSVPVRVVKVQAAAKARKGPAPFEVFVEYSHGGLSASARARHYWMLAAMIGRRANELKLNLGTVRVRTVRDGKKLSEVALPPALVRGVASGSTTPAALLEPFPEF